MNIFFQKSRRLWDNVEKFNRENRPHMTTFWQKTRDLHAG